MRTSLTFDGAVITVTEDGTLPNADRHVASSQQPSMVGLVIDQQSLNGQGAKTVFSAFLPPSRARALASVLLSAATAKQRSSE